MRFLVLAYDLAELLTLLYAGLAGGRWERAAAGLVLLASLATGLLLPDLTSAFREPELGVWLLDLVTSGLFFWIAVRSRSYWPIWAFAFSAAGVASTAARMLTTKTDYLLYYLSESAWPWLIMASICIGTAARTRPWMILRA